MTPDEADRWSLDYPYPQSGIRVKSFPTVTATPTYSAPAASFSAATNVPIEPPVVLRLPYILPGGAKVDSVLRVTTGTWDNRPNFTYQWRRDGVEIDGAVEPYYVAKNSDISHFIDAIVTGTNTAGSVSVASSNIIEITGSVIVPNPGGGTWILITRFWDDGGIWGDEALVVLPENVWILFTGNWDDGRIWLDTAIVVL